MKTKNYILTIAFVITAGSLAFHFLTEQKKDFNTSNNESIQYNSSNEHESTDLDTTTTPKELTIPNKPANDAEITHINGNTVVIVPWNEAEIIDMKLSYSEEEMKTVVDDVMWYTGNAFNFFESKNLEPIASKTQYLSYTVDGITYYLDTKADKESPLPIIMFAENRHPVVINDYVDGVEAEYNAYYLENK